MCSFTLLENRVIIHHNKAVFIEKHNECIWRENFILYLVACCWIEYSEKPLLAAVVVTFVQVTSLLREKSSRMFRKIYRLYYTHIKEPHVLLYMRVCLSVCFVTLISNPFLCQLHEYLHYLRVLRTDSEYKNNNKLTYKN